MDGNENPILRSEALGLRAREILDASGICEAWRAEGAEVRTVGSMRMGLMARHRDIDLHIYSWPLQVERSFAAMARIASRSETGEIRFLNLMHTEERCVEWHMEWMASPSERWTIDMIHIEAGSRYDGYFERVADRICSVMSERQRETILRLKYGTPDEERIAGIEYYRAVIEGGVHDMEELRRWRAQHPATGVVEWMP